MKNTAGIEVTVVMDFSEYYRILTERANKRLRDLSLAFWFSIFSCAFVTFCAWVVGLEGLGMRIALASVFFVAAVLCSLYAFFRFELRREAKKLFDGKITYTISQDGFRSTSEIVTWESPWNRFTEIVESESDFIFIVEQDQFIAIPKRFISSQEKLEHLREVVNENASGRVQLLNYS